MRNFNRLSTRDHSSAEITAIGSAHSPVEKFSRANNCAVKVWAFANLRKTEA